MGASRAYRRWTAADCQRLVAEWQADLTLAEAAAQLGRTRTAVEQHLRVCDGCGRLVRW